jgi:hypothetical protein
MTDFTVTADGGPMTTVYLLTPLTEPAREWVSENLVVQPWQRLGPGIAIEHRFIGGVVEGIINDGLTVGGTH